jgi:hypothetical protein
LTGVPVSTPAVDSPKKELPDRRPYNLFYDDYRWQQRPSEALKFRQELSFLSRKNAQPARPRGASKVFQPAYTAGSADARIDANLQFIRRTNAGFGFVNVINGAGSSPRRCQIVGRITS